MPDLPPARLAEIEKQCSHVAEWVGVSLRAGRVRELIAEVRRLRARVEDLEGAIKGVVTQRADDLCWRDIYTELAKLVGIDFTPELICDQDKFLANCKRFDESLRNGGKYIPVNVEARERWVPVGERLPEPDVAVEVWFAAALLPAHRMRVGRLQSGMWLSLPGDYTMCNVTHWRPMPEGPKDA